MTLTIQETTIRIPARGNIVSVQWQSKQPAPMEFAALICPEDDEDGGGYSIFAINYPGVVSQGDTLEEAKINIAEAFVAMVESRRKRNEAMTLSFRPAVEETRNCRRVWISVDG